MSNIRKSRKLENFSDFIDMLILSNYDTKYLIGQPVLKKYIQSGEHIFSKCVSHNFA